MMKFCLKNVLDASVSEQVFKRERYQNVYKPEKYQNISIKNLLL